MYQAPPAESLIEAIRAGGLGISPHGQHDPVASTKAQPCDRVLHQPGSDTSPLPARLDLYLGQLGPAAQCGHGPAFGEIRDTLAVADRLALQQSREARSKAPGRALKRQIRQRWRGRRWDLIQTTAVD